MTSFRFRVRPSRLSFNIAVICLNIALRRGIKRFPVLLCALALSASLLNPFLLVAQPEFDASRDSVAAADGPHWNMRIAAGHMYQASPDNGADVYLPDYLEVRREDQPNLRRNWGLFGTDVTDNPLFHGAAWLEAGGTFSPFGGFAADLSLYAEHRGISYGVNSRNAIFVTPRYKLRLDTNFHLLNRRFDLGVHVGDTRNARMHEGLIIEHIDVQGSHFYLGYGKLRFEYTKIGDLLNQIGLNINDLDDFSLYWRDQELFSPRWRLDLALSRTFADPYFATTESTEELYGNHVSFAASLAFDTTQRVYAQAARRFSKSDEHSNGELMAFVLGAESQISTGELQAATTLEWRRYGALFNTGYYDRNVYFREETGGNYNNTQGDNVYPLDAFDRGFSQWAVYSELRNSTVVEAFIIRSDIRYNFYRDLYARLLLDLNYIDNAVAGAAAYTFQTWALGWEPQPGNSLQMALTNKTMNLDKHYPTFYEFARDFALELRAKIAVDISSGAGR